MTEYVLTYLAFAIGGVASMVGILAMLLPEKMSGGFGLPTTAIGLHYVRALGVRDIFVGLVVLILGQAGLWTELGYVCIAIAMVAASDFYSVFKYGQRRASIAHFAGIVLSLLFAALFLSQA